MGSYKVSLREKLAALWDLPADAAADQPRVTIVGYREVVVYNHRGITEYSGEQICVAAQKATVKIRGVDLTVKAMNGRDLSVTGQIIGVEFSY